MNATLFARLVAQVEDAGPGAMRVLRPLGLTPSQYVKTVADWNARMEADPSLRAAFDRALLAARQEAPGVPLVMADLMEESLEEPVVALPSYLFQDPPQATVHVAPAHLTSTAHVDMRAILAAITPFKAPGEPPPTAAPRLTLEQHATMTAEIAVAPERAMAVLARYELTPEAKRAMDEHYRAVVAADPGAREAWHQAYRTPGWLAKEPRPAR